MLIDENREGGGRRRAGILLALSSLPAVAGEGVLGRAAYEFVDFLADAGQSFWQILPLGPVGKTLSPYQSGSAFAGNVAFVDCDTPVHEPGCCNPPGASVRSTDHHPPAGPSNDGFLAENAYWLDDYALFETVRNTQKRKPLSQWLDELRSPSSETLAKLRKKYGFEISNIREEQYLFFIQWMELRKYANSKGVAIIGDLPIYVYEDSAEFWLRRRMFDVDGNGRPASLAGVPPDSFSETGQVWDNPVYDWERSGEEVLTFWRERLKQAARLYDGVRIDHFRAFADFYAIPVNQTHQDETGQTRQKRLLSPTGEWRPGPGKKFTDMVTKDFPGLFVIAEDLGDLSAEAKALAAGSGLPGMAVLQFAFTGDPDNPYLPHNIQKNTVCYTGTHDNDTLAGWLRSAPKEELAFAMEYLDIPHAGDLPGALIAQALASKADTAIIPLQDWLGLGTKARLNKPSTVGGRNWKWQIPKGALTRSLAARILNMTKNLYNR